MLNIKSKKKMFKHKIEKKKITYMYVWMLSATLIGQFVCEAYIAQKINWHRRLSSPLVPARWTAERVAVRLRNANPLAETGLPLFATLFSFVAHFLDPSRGGEHGISA